MSTMFAASTLDELAARLHARRQEAARMAARLRAEADAALEDRDLSDIFDNENPGGGSNDVDRGHALALAEFARGSAADVDAALQRLASGRYGRCDRCAARIPLARLRALPETTVCVDCKRAMSRLLAGAR